MDTMNLLTRHYGVTFVLSTATQPALNSREGFGWTFRGLDGVHEIMTDPMRCIVTYTGEVEMPLDFHARQGWEEIAIELIPHESCLLSSIPDVTVENCTAHARRDDPFVGCHVWRAPIASY